MDIPVYLFTGYLESGKTKFIQETMQDKNFNAAEKTLILQCEEGEEELEPSEYPDGGKSVTVRKVESEAELTAANLKKWLSEAKAVRVIVEYNGMWGLDTIYQSLPQNWGVAQEICIADANTFLTFNANMRQQTVDKLNSTEVVIFNRVSEKTDRMELHRLVRAVSRRAKIAYESTAGELEFDEIEDPLPFDINAEIIDIADRNYAVWYRDISEDFMKYNGKKVRFLGIVAKNPKMGNEELALGRHVMVCCEADITYRAFLAKSLKAPELKNYDWVRVTATVKVERAAFYQSKGPVLYINALEKAEKPSQEVATFY